MRVARTLNLTILGMALLLASCAGTTGSNADRFTQHYSGTTFEVTEKELFSVELLVPGDALSTGRNNLRMIIHNRQDNDVSGADIQGTLYRPDSPVDSGQTFEAEDLGDGLYSMPVTVESPGDWRLQVMILQPSRDVATFDFQNVGSPPDPRASREPAQQGHTHADGHGHDHGHGDMKTPQEIDTSTTTTSEKGRYQVSYEPEPGNIPIGSIHSWRIRILDASGNPANPAKIVVDGSMPDHGHGLPTQPQVTEDLGNGYHLVEGVKFSMPGWWVMEVQIYTGSEYDTATFNLMLP
ncbi:MAG: FixH family protein [Desulfovibrionales bacterium]